PASIQMNAFGVDALDFRVYRINDPVRFFEQLEDPHMFGGRAQRPKRELTAIEKFHLFKRRWRMRMVNLIRAQYDADTRAVIRDAMARRAQARAVSKYAEAPLLNSPQVVATWRQPVTTAERWSIQTVPVETKGRGVYLVEAAHKDLRAYTILVVTDLAMITKSAPGRMVAFVVNRRSGKPVSNCDVTLWQGRNGSGAQEAWKTNADGIADAPVSATKNDDLRLLARSGDDFTVSTLAPWNIGTRF